MQELKPVHVQIDAPLLRFTHHLRFGPQPRLAVRMGHPQKLQRRECSGRVQSRGTSVRHADRFSDAEADRNGKDRPGPSALPSRTGKPRVIASGGGFGKTSAVTLARSVSTWSFMYDETPPVAFPRPRLMVSSPHVSPRQS